MAADNPRHIKEILNNILNFIGDKQFWFEQLVFLKNEDYYSYKKNVNKKIKEYNEKLKNQNSDVSNKEKEEIEKKLKKLKITKYKLDEYKLDQLDKDKDAGISMIINEGIITISDDGEGDETEDEYKPSPIFERHYEMLDNTKIQDFLQEEHKKFKYIGTDGLMKNIIDYTKTIEGEIPEVFNFQERLKLVLCGFCHVEKIENVPTLDIDNALKESRAIKDIRNLKIFEKKDGADGAAPTATDGTDVPVSELEDEKNKIQEYIKLIEDDVEKSNKLIFKALENAKQKNKRNRTQTIRFSPITSGGSGGDANNGSITDYLKDEVSTSELIKKISSIDINSLNETDINALIEFIESIEEIYKGLDKVYNPERVRNINVSDKIIQFRARLVSPFLPNYAASADFKADDFRQTIDSLGGDKAATQIINLFKDNLEGIIGEDFFKIINASKDEGIRSSLNEYMKKNLEFIENEKRLEDINVEIEAATEKATSAEREETEIKFFNSSKKKRKIPNLRMLIYFVYCVVKHVLSNGEEVNMDEVLKLIENNTYIDFDEEEDLFKYILGDVENVENVEKKKIKLNLHIYFKI